VSEPIVHALRFPEWTLTALVVALAAGFPVTAVLSWLFDIGPGGVERAVPPRGNAPTVAPPTQAPPARRKARAEGPLPIVLRVVRGEANPREARFGETFLVGRARECDVRALEPFVSRQHLRVTFDGERWSLRDLETMSGTYVNGRPIREVPLHDTVEVEIGQGGPCLSLTVERGGGGGPAG
jgi:pSer/pThr/pTyr-binding forkhead associated (FHA) protein